MMILTAIRMIAPTIMIIFFENMKMSYVYFYVLQHWEAIIGKTAKDEDVIVYFESLATQHIMGSRWPSG